MSCIIDSGQKEDTQREMEVQVVVCVTGNENKQCKREPDARWDVRQTLGQVHVALDAAWVTSLFHAAVLDIQL